MTSSRGYGKDDAGGLKTPNFRWHHLWTLPNHTNNFRRILNCLDDFYFCHHTSSWSHNVITELWSNPNLLWILPLNNKYHFETFFSHFKSILSRSHGDFHFVFICSRGFHFYGYILDSKISLMIVWSVYMVHNFNVYTTALI